MGILDEPCLVLNRNWQPVTFLPIQTAITNVMRDMASVLDVKDYLLLTFEEWAATKPEGARMIKTPSREIPAPDVIVLKQYGERPPRKTVFSRVNLARRDDFTCQYCGVSLKYRDTSDEARGLTIEHVLPRSRGGPTTWENCVSACEACNSRKADMTPREAGMKLRTVPRRPDWQPRIRTPHGTMRDSWRPFLVKELESA